MIFFACSASQLRDDPIYKYRIFFNFVEKNS